MPRELRISPILDTDSYKVTHWKQYPPDTTTVYSYFESRGGKFPATLFFGLQYLLDRYFCGPVVSEGDVYEADKLFKAHFGQDHFKKSGGWGYILHAYNGHLPLRICAVPEGTLVPTRNVLMTIENTDPQCYWLTNWVETALVRMWYPITVATQSFYIRYKLREWLNRTADRNGNNMEYFMFHDFGCRGVSCQEQAAIGGAAHLMSFKGTDNLPGIALLQQFYGDEMPGFSVPAAEHSTITSWGGPEQELDAYRNMLKQFPKGVVAVVGDSYNILRACDVYWGIKLRQEVLNREGSLVIRPDSGDPCEILPVLLASLGTAFGTTINSKGFRVLNPKVRVLQGDGIDFESFDQILKVITDKGWSADNLIFGSGGGLLQKLNRDTCQFAFKCSSVTVGDKTRDVWKSPVHTDANKGSKRGRLALHRTHDGYTTVPEGTIGDNYLYEVFINGGIPSRTDAKAIRTRVTEAQVLKMLHDNAAKGEPTVVTLG